MTLPEAWTQMLPEQHIYAPDGSEIRPLVQSDGASMAHCTLPPGAVTKAVRHRTVEEIWYILSGRGQIWRHLDRRATMNVEGNPPVSDDVAEAVTDLTAGCSLTIPTGAHFQFRTIGDDPFGAGACDHAALAGRTRSSACRRPLAAFGVTTSAGACSAYIGTITVTPKDRHLRARDSPAAPWASGFRRRKVRIALYFVGVLRRVVMNRCKINGIRLKSANNISHAGI